MITYFPKPLNKQVAAISDSLTRTQKGLGIGASGDTHAAIGSGQFVYVKDHSSLAEGLYKSKAAIAQNGALSTSNLTADGSGGLNDLQAQVTSLNSNLATLIKISTVYLTSDENGYAKLPNVDINNHVVLFAFGSGFMAFPFNGGDLYWYVRFTTPSNCAALPSISRPVTFAYINR